jgi:hypothetical protein
MFHVLESASLQWPPQCVSCCSPAIEGAKAQAVIFAGIGLSIFSPGIKHYTRRLEFPICRRHRTILLAKRSGYFASFLALAVFGSLAYVAFFGRLGHLVASVFLVVAIVSLIVLLYCELTAPVRVWNGKPGYIWIAIRNDNYARPFARANEHRFSEIR